MLIDETFVGLSSVRGDVFGNKLGGIFAGEDTSRIRIGQRSNRRSGNQIVGNLGNGIELINPQAAKLFNNSLSANAVNGVLFNGGRDNVLIGNNSSSNQSFGFDISTARNTLAARNRGRSNGLGLFA